MPGQILNQNQQGTGLNRVNTGTFLISGKTILMNSENLSKLSLKYGCFQTFLTKNVLPLLYFITRETDFFYQETSFASFSNIR